MGRKILLSTISDSQPQNGRFRYRFAVLQGHLAESSIKVFGIFVKLCSSNTFEFFQVLITTKFNAKHCAIAHLRRCILHFRRGYSTTGSFRRTKYRSKIRICCGTAFRRRRCCFWKYCGLRALNRKKNAVKNGLKGGNNGECTVHCALHAQGICIVAKICG